MESQSGGKQNGQTAQPLVANQNHQSPGKDQKCRARKRVNERNDQNVKSKADGKKKAKSPGKDQRYRARKRKEVEEMDRELKKARAENEDLKLTNAFSNGKLAQALLDMDLIKGYVSRMKEEVTQNTASINSLQQLQKLKDILRQLQNERAGRAKLKKKCAFLKGKLKQSQEDKAKQIIKVYKLLQQTVKEQNKITKQQNTATEQQTNMINMLMQQLILGTTGFETRETGLSDVRHPTINLSRGTTESGGPVFEELLPRSHQVERAHPPLSYGGWTHGGDMSGSHGLYYPSPPRAAMASGSSPMQGPLAPGGQLPFGGTGLPVHHPLGYQSGTTMGSGGLANENSPGLPQSHVSQGLTHLPWGMTPDNTSDTWEAGPPVHHPPVYLSETTIRPEGPAIEYPLELPQSPLPQGWPHENNFEQPDSTYGDQFIEFSGCSNNIDGSYI